jgi:hypothetical protein
MKNPMPKRWGRPVIGWFLVAVLPPISDGAETATFAKPEKNLLEVATAGSGTTSLPLLVALEGAISPSAA